jgi:formylglycine-generating enzyme required for sulfatase activity
MADIFLSYAREDRLAAERVVRALEELGYEVWWDPDIPAGPSYRRVLQQALESARSVVVLWSTASVVSSWVQDEATEGQERGVLVAARLMDVKPPLGFRGHQLADLSSWDGGVEDPEFRRLLRGVEAHVGPRQVALLASSARPSALKGRAIAIGAAVIVAVTVVAVWLILFRADESDPSPSTETTPSASAPTTAGLPTDRTTAPVPVAPAKTSPAQRFRADAWQLPNEPLLGFIEVNAGPFTMGSDKRQDSAADDNEMPQHQVTLPAFLIGRYEVTVGQYRACVADRGCKLGDVRVLDGPEDFPVRHVSWHEALAYCNWLEEKLKAWKGTPKTLAAALAGRQDGEAWRLTLPSEAQWERAARGTDARVYPWGGGIDPSRANYSDIKSGPTPVGSFPAGASPIGAFDMSGNVWEWTRSLWEGEGGIVFKYPYVFDDGRERLSAPDSVPRVMRGGTFGYFASGQRAAFRTRSTPDYRSSYIGFRVAYSHLRP